MRLLSISTFPLDADGLAKRRATIPPGTLDPDTVLDIVPVGAPGTLLMDSPYALALYVPFIVQAGLRAETDGYDAVVVDTVADTGVDALRSRLSIPVVGAGQAAYATATMLGARFSIITRWAGWRFLHDASLDAYGLRSQCVSIRAPHLPDDVVQGLRGLNAGEAGAVIEAADDYWDAFVEEGRRAVADDGAEVLIVASMTMQRGAALLREALDVPVIDPGPLALRTAQLLVRLGLTHSHARYPSPGILRDDAFDDLLRG